MKAGISMTRLAGLLATTALVLPLGGCLIEDEPDLPPVPPGGGIDEVCGEYGVEMGAKVLLVLDKSGTMFADELAWDHDDDPDTPEIPRWESLHSVVEFVVDGFDDDLSLGAMLFPSADSGCKVSRNPEVPVAANNGRALMEHLPDPDAYYDGYHLTPLPTALEYAVDYMAGFDEGDAKAIILVSDGVPTPSCDGNLSTATTTARMAWEEHGIPTYVVGVAIEEIYAQEYGLLGFAGGRPDPITGFYDTQDEIELQDAVEQITNDIHDCRIKLHEAPTYPEQLSVLVGGESVPQVAACTGPSGWYFADDEQRAIEFCGAACEALEAGEKDVKAIFGCENGE